MIISSEELYSHLSSQAPLTEGTDISEHPAPGTPVTGYRIYRVYEGDKLGSPMQRFTVDKNEIQVDPMGRGFYYWQNRETAEDYLYQTIPWQGDLDSKNLLGMGLFRIEGYATDYPFKEYQERGDNHVGFTADEVKVNEDPILFLSKQDIQEILNHIKEHA
jgi:hypothetical protein